MSVATQKGAVTPAKKDKMADPKTYIHIVIGLILMFGGQHLPPIEPITEVGMQVLFIFIGVIYLWSTVEMLWSSLLAMLALGMSDYEAMNAVLKSHFGDSVVLLVFFSMIFFGAIADSGVVKYVSRWFITRKINNGRPLVFSFIFVFSVYVVSTLTNCFTALLLAWPIIYTMIDDIGYTNKDHYAKFLVYGTFIGSILGQPAIPFRGTKLAMITAFQKASGMNINFAQYILFNIIMAVLIVGGLTMLMKFVYRCDASKMKNLDVSIFDKEPLPPMTKTQKFLFYSMFLYIISLLLPSVLSPTLPGVSFLAKMGSTGLTIAWVILCCVLRLDGKQVINFKAVAGKHVNWGMVFLVMVAIVMSGALTSDATGIKPAIMNVLNPLLAGKSTFAVAAILMIFSFLITNVANNAVCGIIILPVFGTFAAQSGLPAEIVVPITVCAMLCLFLAFLTPAASPYAAMLYGNKEWFTPGEILKFGLPFAVMIVVLYVFIGFPIAQVVF